MGATVNFTYHNMYKFTFCLLFLALAISTSNGKTLEIKQHPSIKMVSCGNHLAPTCAECGNNRRVCTGSCKWEGGKCLGLEDYACDNDCFSKRSCKCKEDEDGNGKCVCRGQKISKLPN